MHLISACLYEVIQISTTNYSVLEVKFVHRQHVNARNYLVGLFQMWGGCGLVVFAVRVSLLFRFRALFKRWNEHTKYISSHWHCNEWQKQQTSQQCGKPVAQLHFVLWNAKLIASSLLYKLEDESSSGLKTRIYLLSSSCIYIKCWLTLVNQFIKIKVGHSFWQNIRWYKEGGMVPVV